MKTDREVRVGQLWHRCQADHGARRIDLLIVLSRASSGLYCVHVHYSDGSIAQYDRMPGRGIAGWWRRLVG